MAQELREAKLEFQEGLGPGHVHKVLCKQHQDIASTSWVQSGRFREGDTFATKRIHSLFNYLDNYVRACVHPGSNPSRSLSNKRGKMRTTELLQGGWGILQRPTMQNSTLLFE